MRAHRLSPLLLGLLLLLCVVSVLRVGLRARDEVARLGARRGRPVIRGAHRRIRPA